MNVPTIILCASLCASTHASSSPFETLFVDNQTIRLQPDLHTSITLTPQRTAEYQDLETQVVTGSVQGNGRFVLAQGPTGVEGCIWAESGTWTISMPLESQHERPLELMLEEFDPGQVGGCAGGILPEHPLPKQQHQPQDGSTSRGIIEPTRVLVVYNTDARDDVSDINAYIVAMIESANEAYINSETDNVQIELAGAYLLDEPFSDDFRTVLRQSTNRYDAVGDAMHALRDATDADVIAMLIDQPGLCGIAWRAPGNAEYAVSTSDTDCALSNLTFAHELGHNQGCTHDPDNAGSGTTPYGFGHRWNNEQWRSVMAYSPGTRVPFFSNPDVLYDGAPTGIDNQRDNARLLDETRDQMNIMRSGDGSGVDTDGNSIPDRLDIVLDSSLDLDRDGVLDAAQINADPSLDCNSDGVLDAEQVNPRVRFLLGTATEFGNGIFNNFTSDPLPVAVSDVQIQLGIVGDVGSSSESLELVFNSGLFSASAFVNTGFDCYSPGQIETITASPAQFDQILAQGISLVLTGSSDVEFDACSYPSLAVWIEYKTTDSSIDADGDGLIDSCNTCTADFNGDGVLNFFDVSVYLTMFKENNPGADLNGDGNLNFFDVSAFLVAYSKGCM